MRRRSLRYSLGALLLISAGLASAQNAFTSRPMNVRAGPNGDYPLVAQLGEGEPLDVHGCLSDWSWCDVSFDDSRGWIYAGGLSFVYQGARVPIYSFGPRLGLPIISFSLLTYWDNYYRRRPWYAQRDEWTHRRLPPHARPPGRPNAGPWPMPSGHPPAGGRPEYSRGHPERDTGRPEHGGGRPIHMTPPPGRPDGGRPPMTQGHPRSGSDLERRGGQTGHTAPRARGGRPQEQHPHGSRPAGHPPSGNS